MKKLLLIVVATSVAVIAASSSSATPPPGGPPGLQTNIPGKGLGPGQSMHQHRDLGNGNAIDFTVTVEDTSKSNFKVSGARYPASVKRANACGSRMVRGSFGYSQLGITVFTYRQNLGFNYCNYLVQSDWAFFDEPVDTCCNWGWHGNISHSRTPIPATNQTVYTKAKFANCGPWYCPWTVYPWIQQRVNGNGNLTGFSYGTG